MPELPAPEPNVRVGVLELPPMLTVPVIVPPLSMKLLFGMLRTPVIVSVPPFWVKLSVLLPKLSVWPLAMLNVPPLVMLPLTSVEALMFTVPVELFRVVKMISAGLEGVVVTNVVRVPVFVSVYALIASDAMVLALAMRFKFPALVTLLNAVSWPTPLVG